MSDIIFKNFTTNKNEIIEILSDSLPAVSAIIRIVDILPSNDVKTALITASGLPVLYYNPEFVDNHCENKIHFAMLILHVLMHVVLGHIFEDLSKLNNLTADAVINAMICNKYKSIAAQSFFINLYNKSNMPEAFLRPKSRAPQYWQRRKYKALYSSWGLSRNELKEIFTNSCNMEQQDISLLGNHENPAGNSSISTRIIDNTAEELLHSYKAEIEEELRIERYKILRQTNIIRNQRYSQEYLYRALKHRHSSPDPHEIDKVSAKIAKLKQKEEELEQRYNYLSSDAGYSESVFVQALNVRVEAAKKRRELEDALKEIAEQSLSSKLETQIKKFFPKIPETSVIPNYRNRRAITSLIADIYNPFFKNKLRPADFGKVNIYIDVSGSVGGYLEAIYKLACNCRDYINDKLYLFSNKIVAISKEELVEGKVFSTGGTDACAFAHALEHDINKMMIVTDGYFNISTELQNKIKKANMKVLAAYTPHHAKLPDGIVTSSIIMNEKGGVTKKIR